MLKDKLMKHLAKKGAKDLDPMDKEAKMGVVSELGRQAGAMMDSKVHPMAKAKHAEGSAEEEKSELPAEEAAEDGAHVPGEESPEIESEEDIEAEHADHSPEELDEKIQKLMALKHKKESGHA